MQANLHMRGLLRIRFSMKATATHSLLRHCKWHRHDSLRAGRRGCLRASVGAVLAMASGPAAK
eukprot:3233517-Amphidinium_carterae.1